MTLVNMAKCLPIWYHLTDDFWDKFFSLAGKSPDRKEIIFKEIEPHRLVFWGDFVSLEDYPITKKSGDCEFTMLIVDREIKSIKVSKGENSYEIN